MITDEHHAMACAYAEALVTGLKARGVDAMLTIYPNGGLPTVHAGDRVDARTAFVVYFRPVVAHRRPGRPGSPSLRVCWDTPTTRVNRPAGSAPTDRTLDDVAAAIKAHETQTADGVADKARVDAAHAAIPAPPFAKFAFAPGGTTIRVAGGWAVVELEPCYVLTRIELSCGRKYDLLFADGAPVLKEIR